MTYSLNPRAVLLNFIMFILFVTFAYLPVAAQTGDLKALKEEVVQLLNQDKYIEALPILEKLIKAEPNNAETYFYLGISYLAQSNAIRDKEIVRQTRIKARKAFITSKTLGSTNKLLDAFIASLPEDGSIEAKFSKILEAEELMLQAETVFTQGDYDEALKLYGDALKIDPTIYEAALFSGDMYLRKNDFPNAEIWYQKAIKINPNRETAYRYSATPLMKQKKYDIARDRYVEAFIVEPYSRFASVGLGQWSEATGTSLGHPVIDIPASVGKSENGNVSITLGMGDDKGDGSFAWTAYGLSRATWQTGKAGLSDNFKKAYPNEREYRHSLAEEYDALKTTATILKERMNDKKSPVKKLDPQLEILLALHSEGLLEPYILLARTDEGIARDYDAYLKQNRDKLRQYVVKYVIRK